MLLDLSSDAYLVFHIKINDNSCDLLFDTLFISLDPKKWLYVQITEQRLVTMSVSLHTQTGWPNLTIQSASIDSQYNFLTLATLHNII